MALQVRTAERKLAAWEPVREMENMERQFENMFRQPFFPTLQQWSLWQGKWMPAIDVIEKNDKLLITAELPGIKAEDIDISFADGTLSIKGEKKTEKEAKGEAWYRAERSYGSFLRSIDLPSGIDANKINAEFENGVLEITVPKTTPAAHAAKKVTIKKKA